MLTEVQLDSRSIQEYRDYTSGALFDEITELSGRLAGKRILQINATQSGGGVAAILRATVPLLRGLGLAAHWQCLVPEPGFFGVTKRIHNGLQGDPVDLTLAHWELYQKYNARLAKGIVPAEWDLIVIHDPQPAAALSYVAAAGPAKWLWRCHIDSRHAAPAYRQRFATYLKPYDGLIYTMQRFVIDAGVTKPTAIIPMAIDPLVPKNQPMSQTEAAATVQRFGIDTSRPLVVQVSRFDPWKDPLGVIEAWRQAKQKLPGLQLALVGDTASDDPQGAEILGQVRAAVAGESGAFVVADEADDRTVKAFQTAAAVVLQKSLREGFGLTVTEALWAGTPVIGGSVGGITLQIQNGINGYLVESVAEASDRIVELVQDPSRAKRMGEAGHKLVGERFLLPRLLCDDLAFWAQILELE